MSRTQKRFTPLDRLFHLGLVVTFLVQSATGLGRLYVTTPWGGSLVRIMGGYEHVLLVHYGVGVAMTLIFLAHVAHTLVRVGRRGWLGPDSLVFSWRDFRHFGQNVRWVLGRGESARLGRWSYWEKFDYWAIFWGMPILAVTGIMLYHSVETSRYIAGWGLNIAGVLHRAEALLAMGYIFLVHFFMGHLRPSAFPMNPTIFTGEMGTEEVQEEKPAWADELKREGLWANGSGKTPSLLFKTGYTVFGYTAVVVGLYLLVNTLILMGQTGVH